MDKKQTNRLIFFVVLISIGTIINYFLHFHDGLSDNNSDWGAFGDYVGGLLNPFFSFLAFIFLIWSIRIQILELELSRKAMTRSANAAEQSNKLIEIQNELEDKSLYIQAASNIINNVNNDNSKLKRIQDIIMRYMELVDLSKEEISHHNSSKSGEPHLNTSMKEIFSDPQRILSTGRDPIHEKITDIIINNQFNYKIIQIFVNAEKKVQNYDNFFNKIITLLNFIDESEMSIKDKHSFVKLLLDPLNRWVLIGLIYFIYTKENKKAMFLMKSKLDLVNAVNPDHRNLFSEFGDL